MGPLARAFVLVPLLALVSCGVFVGAGEARWATDEDASWEIEYQDVDTVVHRDGTSESVTRARRKVLKESARSNLAVARYGYNANIQTFEVLEARTVRAHGEPVVVDPTRIEDKPMASSRNGFDELHQVIVPFSDVEVGASVETTIRVVTKSAALPGFWSTELAYGTTRERAGRVTIRADRPLHVEKNDPSGVLEVEQTSIGAGDHVTVTLTAPVQRVAVDEDEGLLGYAAVPWVAVSTDRDWVETARSMSDEYERVLAAPLPDRFETIRARAAGVTALTDRINVVTSELAAQIHYLGDWRTRAGKYVPRTLAAVAETQYGDCKDFAATTTAILRGLGLRADVAWIRRGMRYRRRPVAMALASDFNHAIVRVRADGRDRWIDPTNFTSFAQGTYPDLAGRSALVISRDAPELLTTSPAEPADAEVRVSRVVHFAADNQRVIDGALALRGASAIEYTGAELTHSKRSIDYALARHFGAQNDLREWRLRPYDLGSRVVRDLEFRAHLVQRDSPMRTTAGDAFYLGNGGPPIEVLLTPTDERVSDLVNGAPQVYRSTTVLRDVKRVGQRSLDCSVESPWVDFTRTVVDVSRGVRIDDRAVLRREIIPIGDVKSPRFAEVQARIRECLSGASVVYERASPGADATLASSERR